MRYTLMNKNRPLADIELDTNGFIASIYQLFDVDALPVGVLNDKMFRTLNNLNRWWKDRIIPRSRQSVGFVLSCYDLASRGVLAEKGLGLSLSDQYWLRPSTCVTWCDVNFFTNDFSMDIGDALFGNVKDNPDWHSPDSSCNGWLKKRWFIDADKRYLLKGGSGTLVQEPFNEVVASRIMDTLGIKHVEYSLRFENSRTYSMCETFVTSDTEFVPAHCIMGVQKKLEGVTYYEHLLSCCETLEIVTAKESLAQMAILDRIIANTDRHYGNFGFIRDVNTLKFLGMAPVFDCGTSLYHSVPMDCIGEVPAGCFLDDGVHIASESAALQDKIAECASTAVDIFAELGVEAYVGVERIHMVVDAVKRNIQRFDHERKIK